MIQGLMIWETSDPRRFEDSKVNYGEISIIGWAFNLGLVDNYLDAKPYIDMEGGLPNSVYATMLEDIHDSRKCVARSNHENERHGIHCPLGLLP